MDHMAKNSNFAPTAPLHPGEILRKLIKINDIKAFASKVGVSRVSMSRLLNGQNGISPQMALSLGDVLGTNAEKWMSLQMEYDLWHAREDRREALSQREHVKGWVSAIVFKSQTRPGRTVRINGYPTAISANKRKMKEDTVKEPKLF
jgi:addiction module HigA family antidote